jgi:hypothetical protein
MDNTALPAERQNENAGHYAVVRSWFAASRRDLVESTPRLQTSNCNATPMVRRRPIGPFRPIADQSGRHLPMERRIRVRGLEGLDPAVVRLASSGQTSILLRQGFLQILDKGRRDFVI